MNKKIKKFKFLIISSLVSSTISIVIKRCNKMLQHKICDL
jgi:hypothetical protein